MGPVKGGIRGVHCGGHPPVLLPLLPPLQVGHRRGIPCQEFSVRNDMPCGSTIGPILASNLGCR